MITIEKIYPAGYLHLLGGIMDDLQLKETIDRMVPVDAQCLTTVGEAVKLLVLDMLSGRQPLVHIEKWAARQDLDRLIREGAQASSFNDDTLGRHLDRLHEADMHRVYSAFQLHVYKRENIPMRAFHGDTTSKSVYGAYTKPSEALKIVEGYSRDRRGAKQIQFGMVGNSDGIPIYADVHDGDTSDKTWNPDVLEAIHKQCRAMDLKDYVYVADSAAMSKQTLKAARAAGAHLLTRAPNHLKIVKAALEAADAPDAPWSEPIAFASGKEGAVYRWFERAAEHDGHALRLIVVESSALDKKKEKTLSRQREDEAASLADTVTRLDAHVYHCRADAQQAADVLAAKTKPHFHRLAWRVTEQVVLRKKRGRPKAGAVPETTLVYRVHLEVTADEAMFQQARRRASRFVLAATVPEQWQGETMDGGAVLGLYKGQIHVEMNFSFLKDPVYTDEIYLKKPERVKVLGYLFLLALTVYRVFQRRIRQHITAERPMRGAGGRILRSPTSAAIFQIFKYLQIVAIRLPDGTRIRQFSEPLEPEQRRILTCLGFDESLYLG